MFDFYIVALTFALLHTQIMEISMDAQRSNGSKVSPFRDIYVHAFVRDRKILELNVTLLVDVDSKYDVTVSSLPDNKSEYCSDVHHCYMPDIPENQTSVTFPTNAQFLTEHEECLFENDCFYNISIKTVNGKYRQSTLYHIKECVGNLCACRHANNLPQPTIIPVAETRNQLDFKWEVITDSNHSIPNEVSLRYLTVDIVELKDCSVPWSGGAMIASFHEKLDNFNEPIRAGSFTKLLPENVTSKCALIRMNVVDSQSCNGPVINRTVSIGISLPDTNDKNVRQPNFTIELILICVAGAFFVFVAILTSFYVYLWRSRKKNIVNYWRGIYHNVQHGGSSMGIPMRENILYFEKENEGDGIEIPHGVIREIGREIGKGAFGRVFIARVAEIPGKLSSQIVAIKKLKKFPTTDQLEEFLGEIATMKRVGRHPNVVRLLGFCTLEQPLMMIMEFVPCGDLLKYLRKVRVKHEEKLAKLIPADAGASQANNSMNSNSNNSDNSGIKQSTSNHSQIFGPLGRYLDILHSHSTSSASETSSYITQPDSLPSSSLQINGSGPCTSRPSYAETMYTNLTAPSNPELTSMINTNLEYVVDNKELHNFAIQIARGMKHLEERQITHRDLAARNILIDENKVLKISDFGLSRTGIYVNTKNKKVPLRWLSIEAMKDNLYSSKSDVWAFAIVLWEIGTLGGFPYPTVSNHELLTFIKSGQRLERPENCSDTLYALMLQCWAMDPEERPAFSDICRKLDPNRNKIYIDFSELSPSYVFPPTHEEFKLNTAVKKLSKA